DAALSSFAIVLAAERLPVLETIELHRELTRTGLDVGALVVNKRSPAGASSSNAGARSGRRTWAPSAAPCPACRCRRCRGGRRTWWARPRWRGSRSCCARELGPVAARAPPPPLPALPPPQNCRIREANGPEAFTSHIRQRNGGPEGRELLAGRQSADTRRSAECRQATGRAVQAAASTSAGFARSVHASTTAAVVITPPNANAQLAPLAWATCAEA